MEEHEILIRNLREIDQYLNHAVGIDPFNPGLLNLLEIRQAQKKDWQELKNRRMELDASWGNSGGKSLTGYIKAAGTGET
jgi:hypothetical protein